MKKLQFRSFRRVYEGEGDGDGNTNTDPPAKTFGQEDVDRIVQERLAKAKKGHEKEKQSLLGRVEALGLSAQQKEELEEQMEQMRLKSATKEEQTAAAIKKKEKAWGKERDALVAERDSTYKLYATEKVERELLAAAGVGENPAVRPQQIVDILSPRTQVVKEMGEDGKPTGKLVTRVRMTVKKEDGTFADLQLSPTEALAQMKEQPESFGNLFQSGAKSGLGGSGSAGGGSGPVDYKTMSMDTFMENYKKNPDSVMG